ncbi:class F sortase [Alkalibacillus almallahensis]|uniref:class F sortase n=1 Tax=Alkalibacillus almallahensis TaxID=1379154 RepID=UPI001422A7ED|nr:class F sortase [Alkalibacillus almallahensis]NIK10641.1 LPXTG-site transpeptidase (sortase) family protein [Alkalibacillus almallahensis]
MKPIISLICVLFFLIFLIGCASSTQNQMSSNNSTDSESAFEESEEKQDKTSSNDEIEKRNTKSKIQTSDHMQNENSFSSSDIIKDERNGITPTRIKVPAIGVDTKIEHVGLLDNGQMDVPDGLENVAWYEPGTKPGARGNSVIAGHVDDTVNPAVFYDLHKLESGDEVIITDKHGKELTFEVFKKEVYPRKDSPVKEIFGYSHRSLLNLITCEGEFDHEFNGREERLVVYTELKK